MPDLLPGVGHGTSEQSTSVDRGKLAQVLKEMQNYQLDILGVTEIWWTGQGQILCLIGYRLHVYDGQLQLAPDK